MLLIVVAALPAKWLATLGLWDVGFPFTTDGRKRLLPRLILQELQFLLLRVKYYTMQVMHVIHICIYIYICTCTSLIVIVLNSIDNSFFKIQLLIITSYQHLIIVCHCQVFIPENCKGWVTGNRGSELRRMEVETGTYMFMALDKRGEDRAGRKMTSLLSKKIVKSQLQAGWRYKLLEPK